MEDINNETRDKVLQVAHKEASLSLFQSQIPLQDDELGTIYPTNVFDKDNQQVELNEKSSWTLECDDINVFEFAETQIINSWSPFLLCSELFGLLKKSDFDAKFIINVSSMEGKFNRYKSSHHVHTNMSKAALNMLTLTCGSYFAKENVYMNSVDTGWVSEMDPYNLYKLKRTVPLDELDGAMRVLDPIIDGINNKNFVHSKFLKDYKESSW